MYRRGINILAVLGIINLYQILSTTIIAGIVSKGLSIDLKEALSATLLMSNEIILNMFETFEYFVPFIIFLAFIYLFFGPEEKIVKEVTVKETEPIGVAKLNHGSQFIDFDRIDLYDKKQAEFKTNEVYQKVSKEKEPELLTDSLKKGYFENEQVEFFSKPMAYMSKTTENGLFKINQKITDLDLTDEIFEK